MFGIAKKQSWLIGAFLALALGALLVRTTPLGAVLTERYPATEWPARGAFAVVHGANKTTAAPTNTPANNLMHPRLMELFSESGGKALLVSQAGQLKLENYAQGMDQQTQFNSFSMVKSLIGLLVLKSIAEGRIDGTHVPLGTLLPEITNQSLRNLTLQSLLDMKSGVIFETGTMKTLSGSDEKDLEQTLLNPFGPMAKLHFSGPGSVLEKLTSDPKLKGTFSYQNINTVLLGLALERVYNQPLETVLSEKIWQPSGASDAMWRLYPGTNQVSAYCCLYATAHDWISMARFLMTNGTTGSPFLPEDLWRQFMGKDLGADALHSGDYSLHARHDILDRGGEPLQGRFTYFIGQGGQTLYMMPEYDLVVVRFGERHQKLHSTLYTVWLSLHS